MTQKPSRLAEAMLETADDMRAGGLLDAATHQKITMRHREAKEAPAVAPLSPAEIRDLRERANMSQAAFARRLNLTTGYISQLERGAKRATGPALVLLNVIRRRGMEALS